MSESINEPKKRRWATFLKRLIVGLAIIVALSVIAAKTFFLPTYLQQQFEQALGDYWDGTAQIRKIDLNFSGPVVLNQVTLLDHTRQRWIYIDKIRLIFSNWPSLHPVLTTIEIDQPDIQLYQVDGKFTPPLKKPAPSDSGNLLAPYIDIRNITVRDFSISTINQDGMKKDWNDIQISARRQGAAYNVFLSRITYNTISNLMVSGTIDPNNLETRLSVELSHQAQREQTAQLIAALDIPILRQAEGKLLASIDISGRLNEPQKLQFNGVINLNDWNISAFHSLEIINFNTVIKASGRRFDFERIIAQTVEGSLQGSFYADLPINRPMEFGGKLSLEKADLDKLTDAITELPKITQGTATAHYAFSVYNTGIQSLNGFGMLFLDNAHLWNLPVILQLFDQFKINHRDPLSTSDLISLFAMKGPETIFQHAILANAISAIEMEPGGKVNLQTQNIDMFVIGVPLKTLRKVIAAIPIIKLIIPLRDRFSRLHLRGYWYDPPAALIFKEPFKKVKQNTENVFDTISKTGGQFSEQTVKLFNGMFDELSRKKTTPTQ